MNNIIDKYFSMGFYYEGIVVVIAEALQMKGVPWLLTFIFGASLSFVVLYKIIIPKSHHE